MYFKNDFYEIASAQRQAESWLCLTLGFWSVLLQGSINKLGNYIVLISRINFLGI